MRSEEHTSELQSPLIISYAVFSYLRDAYKTPNFHELSLIHISIKELKEVDKSFRAEIDEIQAALKKG